MSTISFLAIPNVVGMRIARYLQILVSLLLFGVCLFFVLYFLVIARRRKQHALLQKHLDQRAGELEKTLLLEKIRKSSGKALAVLFIDYLERFVTNKTYTNLTELLLSHGFTAEEAEELSATVYIGKPVSKILEHKIYTMLNEKGKMKNAKC